MDESMVDDGFLLAFRSNFKEDIIERHSKQQTMAALNLSDDSNHLFSAFVTFFGMAETAQKPYRNELVSHFLNCMKLSLLATDQKSCSSWEIQTTQMAMPKLVLGFDEQTDKLLLPRLV